MSAILDLFHQHVASSFDKQLKFAELTAGDNQKYDVDVQSGKFRTSCMRKGAGFFAKKNKVDQSFDLQVLGSEAHGVGTWMWIWANKGVNYPESVKEASLKMKALGESEGIAELSDGEFSSDVFSGENLALIASGVCDALAYLPLPYGGGCAFMLVYSDEKQPLPENPLPRILTVFPQLVSAIAIKDHKQAFKGYLDYFALSYTERDGVLDAKHPWGNIEAKFDDLNRMIDMSGNMAAPANR